MLQLQQQQRRGGGGGGGTNVSAAVARALASSQPLPRARSARISLRRLEAIMERSLMTTFCRSESEQQSSNNRGGIAESSNAAANRGVDSSDGALPPPRPSPAQKKKSRMRLDEAASLVAGCETVSRTVIQSWIARGKVLVDGVPVTKAGHSVPASARVEVRAAEERFVCRGGLKLDAALAEVGIDVEGMRAIDCGLSTGGFADRLLQGGAEAVLGVDVGYGKSGIRFLLFCSLIPLSSCSLSFFFALDLDLRFKLVWSKEARILRGSSSFLSPKKAQKENLGSFGTKKKTRSPTSGQVAEKIRTDPRLFSLERTNARRLVPSMLPRGAPRSYDIATLDVSFISVLKVRGEEVEEISFSSFFLGGGSLLSFSSLDRFSHLFSHLFSPSSSSQKTLKNRSSRPSPRSSRTPPSSSSWSSRSSRPGKGASAPEASSGT